MKAIFFAIVMSLNAKIFRILTPMAIKLCIDFESRFNTWILKPKEHCSPISVWCQYHIFMVLLLVKPYVLSYWTLHFRIPNIFTYSEKTIPYEAGTPKFKCIRHSQNQMTQTNPFTIYQEKVYTSSLSIYQ